MTVQTPELLTEHEARRLTERIRAKVLTVAEGMDRLRELVEQARTGRAWEVLGFPSWTAYLADVVGDQPMRLERDQRRPYVELLAGEGVSVRGIAGILGEAKSTIHDDLSGVRIRTPEVTHDVPPEPDPGPTVYDLHDPEFERIDPATGEVLDMDEVEFMEIAADSTKEQFEDALAAARADGDLSRTSVAHHLTSATTGGGEAPVVAEPRKVTGLDGKQYTRPEPSIPRRKALPEQFLTATLALTDKVQAIVRLAEDDRFTANAEKVATANRSDLIRAIDALSGVVAKLPERNIS
jgi:hypothetical protein